MPWSGPNVGLPTTPTATPFYTWRRKITKSMNNLACLQSFQGNEDGGGGGRGLRRWEQLGGE